ncbi:MAG: SpoIIE family protein phosphatase, partial [Solirubrobacterales bacterium]|nr:SpoIIE family protein phosphatase [Solirubrobacterales bacterium]
MSVGAAEELLADAPCGYLTSTADGTITGVNRTLELWTGRSAEELGGMRFVDLLAVGGRIYHDTHLLPLLHAQGAVQAIALDLVRADGARRPVLMSSALRRAEDGTPEAFVTVLFDATDRRRYEEELRRARHREAEVSRELQRSLLGGTLPGAPGLDVGVVYRPAAAGTEAGGDWYDAFWLEEGEEVALVVGDVVGKGLGAAAAMGQLRSAARALAATGLEPGPLLDAMDTYVRRHGVGDLTTLVCAWLHLGTGAVRYACAGHPPPALLDAAGTPVLLWEGRGLPLGPHRAADRTHPTGTARLEPGGTLLLYSDGLVERRGGDLDAGFRRLLGALQGR